MLKHRNGSKGDSHPGSLDCESGVLSLRYRAMHPRRTLSLSPGPTHWNLTSHNLSIRPDGKTGQAHYSERWAGKKPS